ncbi:uncharacterized protein LOC117344788 [Pecten maximus]|uniref:uncharacterized protein LOC117344788 n=1 Tax=Pecten maximus TaxID=6579 RepID=UPI0014587C0C|nr:uncharacterized protein LOC117344788 [Pecten maximus]
MFTKPDELEQIVTQSYGYGIHFRKSKLTDWRMQIANYDNTALSINKGLFEELEDVRVWIGMFERARLKNVRDFDLILGHVSWLTEKLAEVKSENLKTLQFHFLRINIREIKSRTSRIVQNLDTYMLKTQENPVADTVDDNDTIIYSRLGKAGEEDEVLAVKVGIMTPNQRNEVAEIPFDAKEHVLTEFFHLDTRKLSEKPDLRCNAKECLDLSQASDGKESLVLSQKGRISLSVTLAVKPPNSKYNLRYRNNGKWETTEATSSDKGIIFLIDALSGVDVVVTATRIEESIYLCPGNGPKDILFGNNKNIKLHCPEEAVKEPQYLYVSHTSVDEAEATCNRDKSGNTDIVGITPVAYVRHEQPFAADLTLTLPIMMLADVDLSQCDIVLFHVENDNVTETDIVTDCICREDSTCTIKTSKFCGVGVAPIRRQVSSAQVAVENEELETLIGLSVPCSVLIFLGKGKTKMDWMMMADIVPESEVKDRIISRVNDEQYCVPLNSRSGSIYLKRKEVISIDFGKSGNMTFSSEIARGKTPVIHFFHKLKENYALFPSIVKGGISKATRGAVEFSKRGKVFYTAYPCPDLLQKSPSTK